MKLTIHQVDAFSDKVFSGNYAAVIITEQWLPDELMQSIASENNLSETAFAKIIADQHYELRWFSPLLEIDFCGHATLATAFVLFSQHPLLNELTFTAKAVGDMIIKRLNDGFIEMSFPNRKPEIVDTVPTDLLNALSISPQQVLKNQQAYFVIYDKEQHVHSIQIDMELIKQLAPFDVVVTAPSNQYDFISRYFWPANGGDEDPVTGSIHTGLAPYWANRLNKNELIAYQASKRGGLLKCRVTEDRVFISGKAVLYLEGTLYVSGDYK